jgi:uncharacterized membrane protein (UPF0127 family)
VETDFMFLRQLPPSAFSLVKSFPARALLHITPAAVRALLCGALLLVTLNPAAAQQSPTEFRVIALQAGIHLIQAEIGANPSERERGLMFREKLGPNQGMAFLFDQLAIHCMWMKNTYLPLSVAFLSEDGTILNIADMKPRTEDSHCAEKPARYALEMNLGWFAKRGIKAGARILGLPKG